MRTVKWSSRALDDLNDVITYIALENPRAARDVIDKIDAAGEALGDMPTGRPGRMAGTYEKVVSSSAYIIAYGIETRRDGEEQIVIFRVIHGARDWTAEKWPG